MRDTKQQKKKLWRSEHLSHVSNQLFLLCSLSLSLDIKSKNDKFSKLNQFVNTLLHFSVIDGQGCAGLTEVWLYFIFFYSVYYSHVSYTATIWQCCAGQLTCLKLVNSEIRVFEWPPTYFSQIENRVKKKINSFVYFRIICLYWLCSPLCIIIP